MPNREDVIEVTDPVQVDLVDDRLHCTFISGKRHFTFALSFHKAANGCHGAMGLLQQARMREAQVVKSIGPRPAEKNPPRRHR